MVELPICEEQASDHPRQESGQKVCCSHSVAFLSALAQKQSHYDETNRKKGHCRPYINGRVLDECGVGKTKGAKKKNDWENFHARTRQSHRRARQGLSAGILIIGSRLPENRVTWVLGTDL